MMELTYDQIEFATARRLKIDTVVPDSERVRLQKLKETLSRTDVPYPINGERARNYYQQAISGLPFSVGSLTDQHVELSGYENQQDYESLTTSDHLSWACLISDQQATKETYACREYLLGEEMFEIGGRVIPDYYNLNARIFQQTGWQLATVSEIIPAHVFFHCHSRKFFPVTTFMRPLGTDYLEEPDIGHDIAGHVATFTIPEVAQVMNNHGLANDIIHREKETQLRNATTDEEALQIEANATELLLYAGRLYWFTVEFGLVAQREGLRAFGAGILSSPGETKFSIESQESNRIMVRVTDDRDLLRLATTDYLISEYQKTYFVLEDFASLSSMTPERIVSIVKTAQRLPHHSWRDVLPTDDVIDVGSEVNWPLDKYSALLARKDVDACTRRTAIRNMRILSQPFVAKSELEFEHMSPFSTVSRESIDEFKRRDLKGEFND